MKFNHIFSICFILTLFSSCDKPINPDVLATVGSREVTSFEFAGTYSNKLKNSDIQDSELERANHLDFLIRNKLFSEAAIQNKLSLDSIAHRYIYLDSIKFLRDELYYDIIMKDTIMISDATLRQHYEWSYRECDMRQLLFNSKEEADSIYLHLSVNPDAFDSISIELFSKNTTDKSNGDMGWVTYNTIDPNLENTVYKLEIGAFSKPIQSSIGWHILKKIDERNHPILNENEFEELKEKIKLTVQQKYFQIQSDQFVNQLLLSKNILMDDRLIQDVSLAIYQLNSLANNPDTVNVKRKKGIMNNLVSNLRDVSHVPMAEYNGGQFTVQNYFDGVQSIPPNQLSSSPQMAFYQLIRNQILSEEGGKRGYGSHTNVKRKLQDTKDNFLSRAYLSSYFKGSQQAHFQKSTLDKIADSLRQTIKVQSYPKHLSQLFELN